MLGKIIRALGPRFEADLLTIREKDMGYVQKIRKHRMLRVPVSGSYLERVEAFQRALSRQLDGDEYDIIHFRSPWEGAVLHQKKQYFDARYVYEPGVDLPLDAPPEIVEHFIECEKISLDLADMVILPSHVSETTLRAMGYKKPVEVVCQGVDIDTFDWEYTTGLPPFDLIWVDSFTLGVDTDFVLSAITHVVKEIPSFSMGIVGEIEYDLAENLVNRIDTLNLKETIKFFGHQTDDSLPLLISRSRLAMVPPPRKYFGIVPREDNISLLEYMACRTATLAPATPYIAEMTKDGKLARLYDWKNPLSLAHGILELLHDKKSTEAMEELAYKTARNELTSTIARRELVQIYAKLVPTIEQLSADEVFTPSSSRSGSITWQGARTSSTGSGAAIPTALTPVEEAKESGIINLEMEDIEFEASGALLGITYEGGFEPNTSSSDQTDPQRPKQ
ncbi:glycosyltransferase [Myxococcota bacterium]|nr:glycosyltransferase [Myxococcota bacterium]